MSFLGRCVACLDNAFTNGGCQSREHDCLERREREAAKEKRKAKRSKTSDHTTEAKP